MKRRNYSFLFVVVLLVGLNCYSLFKTYIIKRNVLKNEKNVIEQINSNTEELHWYRYNLNNAILNSGYSLNDVMICDTLSNTFSIRRIFEKNQKQKLVCRISQMHCQSCVNAMMNILHNWSDSIDCDNIVLFGNYNSNRIFLKTLPQYMIKNINAYNVSSLNVPVDGLGFPYFFLIDSSLNISNVFIPKKGIPKLTNYYLDIIAKKIK